MPPPAAVPFEDGFSLQQYLEKQLVHAGVLSTPALPLVRSTTAQARHVGQSGSAVPFAVGIPRLVRATVAFRKASWRSVEYARVPVEVDRKSVV